MSRKVEIEETIQWMESSKIHLLHELVNKVIKVI